MKKTKIPLSEITKQGPNTESYYDYIISRYVAPLFTVFFKKLRINNPNIITYFSFSLILISSLLVLHLDNLNKFSYRLIVAILIQLSFIMDCSDGQLARINNKTSKIGAWLDRILDRVGEFIIFSTFGFVAYLKLGNVIYIFLGISTGYMLSAFTLSMTLGDSVLLENYQKIRIIKAEKPDLLVEDTDHPKNRESIKAILQKVFFFLNFGIGERYLYLSFFILIYRIDIMLYITTFLSITRTFGMFIYTRERLKKIDIYIKEKISGA